MKGKKLKVIVIGGGPAGLTSALTMLNSHESQSFDIVVLESSIFIGGISRTHVYKGNRMDIGGHRFFSKSDRVMQWWQEILPIQSDNDEIEISYQGKKRRVSKDLPTLKGNESKGLVMLVRNRLSRIYYLRNFFSYPIKLSFDTIRKLGFVKLLGIGFSYVWARLLPIKNEKSLEDFLINRFGKVLYKMFFKDYTEKVWGVSCQEISAEWGAQRIKGLSITEAIKHAIKPKSKSANDINQKGTETSLIEKFLYPRLGPGMMWETVGERIIEQGGIIQYKTEVVGFIWENQKITGVKAILNGEEKVIDCDYVISSMPIQQLVKGLGKEVPKTIREISEGLIYRDFITVGLLIKGFKNGEALQDNWIYIQEKDVKIGRLQIFNNWSPDLVADKNNTWLGLEYFCQEGDELWNLSKDEMLSFAVKEMVKLDLINEEDVLDGTVLKVPKTYPAYFGTYNRFDELKNYLNEIDNLFLIGRNGMHRYNNQDHSMLTGMLAAEQILTGSVNKEEIWSVNTEMEYHEEK